MSVLQSNPFMVHSNGHGEWEDRDSFLPRVFFSPWIPVNVSDHGQETNKENCKFCALTSFSSLLAQPLLLAPKTTAADKLHHGGTSPFPRTEDDSLTYSRSYYCWKSSWRENQIIPWDNTFHLNLPGLMLHRKILHQEVLTLSLWNTVFSLVNFNKHLKILWPERRPNHLITSLTSSYQCTMMVTEKLWMAPNQDLFLGFQIVNALAKRAWSKVYSSPR